MTGPLSPADRQRLETLFEQAAEVPAAARADFLAKECGANDALRDELARLLAGLERKDVLTQHEPGAPLPPGTRIGAYKLLERVGQGGMGEVYAAEQSEPVTRRVALKVIKRGMDSAQVVARFDAERQALARMGHPHIAQVYDGGTTDDGRPFFVMEFVAGDPITDYCDRHKLATRVRLDLFLDICQGVQHAHMKGIIHRDLKPSNLLVTEQDGRAVGKIIDFGIARAVTGRLAERTLHTMLGQIVGTLDYMSPEQADPTALDIDTRADVYSLGVVLYQLLSGLLPFEHAATDLPFSEVQRRIREHEPPTPSTRLRRQTSTATALAPQHGTDGRSLIRQLAGDLDWICLKALEKDPARRYQSVAELADDVRRHLAHVPVRAGRPGPFYRAQKFVRRNRAAVIASVLIAGSATVGISGIVAGRLDSVAAASVARAQRPHADAWRLTTLVQRADHELWPPLPSKIVELQGWLDEANRLASTLGERQADLVAMAADAPSIATPEYQVRHDALTKLVRGLQEWLDATTGLLGANAISTNHGWSVPRRLDHARQLQAGFAAGGAYAEAWARMLPDIHAAYPGLELKVQAGLLPLWQDPVSKLWEFAHLLSGEPAEHDATGKVLMQPAAGLVLVLLPGGTFLMGAQADDATKPNYDPQAKGGKPQGPVHEVTVPAVFVSKFEMTQAQWERLAGLNPSWEQEGLMTLVPLSPVNQVTWTDCDTMTRRMGLTLPSEEQWEYAARGGTSTIRWMRDDDAAVREAENILAANRRPGAQWVKVVPVGSFAANPFGLYDMLGNVGEWCSNHPYKYLTEPGSSPETLQMRAARGVGGKWGLAGARSACREAGRTELNDPILGLRPARAVE